MSLIFYVGLAVFLTLTAGLYLFVARRFKWFDKPNERSLHTETAIVRGGGVLFYVSVCYVLLFTTFHQPCFFAGLTFIALVSFWDDFQPMPIRYRLTAQFLAMAFMFWQTAPFSEPVWVLISMLIVAVGVLNAFNFMDGINGMTAFYGVITVGTLWYCEAIVHWTTPSALFPAVLIALLTFGWFNARTQAVWFAGDVGSMSIGYICVYGLLRLVVSQQTYLPVLFLSVYGVDSVLTILYRLYHRQPILRAHRLHLFQLLVYQLGWPHRRVSALYAMGQLGINVFVVWAMNRGLNWPLLFTGCVLSTLVIFYLTVRFWVIHAQKKVGFLKPTSRL